MDPSVAAAQELPLWQTILGGLFLIGLIPAAWYFYRIIRHVQSTGGWVSVADVVAGDVAGAALLANVFIFLFLLAVFAAFAQQPGTPMTPTPGASVFLVIFQLAFYGVILGAIFGALKIRKVSLRAFFGLNNGNVFKRIGQGLLILLAAYPFIGVLAAGWQFLLTEVLKMPLQEQDAVLFIRGAATQVDKIAIVFLAVVIAPIGEEFVFRGYLLPVLKRYWGHWPALLCTSVFFGLIHANWAAAAPLILLGIMLALAYEHTGSLWAPITMHMVFNSITTAVLFLSPAPAEAPELHGGGSAGLWVLDVYQWLSGCALLW